MAQRRGCYAQGMDPDGVTPWYAVIILFAYAGAGWVVFAALYLWFKHVRNAPQTATKAAFGYGESWRSNSQSEV